MKDANLDHYAVMGNPIAHSKSPQIHTLFARQTDEAMRYSAILVGKGELAGAISQFQAEGGKGLNITLPFKQQAWELVHVRSARATLAGAINTIVFRDQQIRFGDNTDGVGLVRDLITNHGATIAGRQVLVVGAGGAVCGVLGPLLEQGPAQLVIANRTVDKAHALAQRFAPHGVIKASSFEQLEGQSFDLIVNGTAASLQGEVPALPWSILERQPCCYDMMYGADPTPFLVWAKTHGAHQIIDGLGMLIEQAAESFYIWRGVMPETAPVIETLRNTL